jgi:hypothetical protein
MEALPLELELVDPVVIVARLSVGLVLLLVVALVGVVGVILL